MNGEGGGEMTARVHDDWLLTPQGVAVHAPTATAVLADLHLGYNEARRRRGEAVPLVALEELLAPLAAVFWQCDVARLVIAGDLLEDAAGAGRVGELLRWLEGVGVALAGVVPGN